MFSPKMAGRLTILIGLMVLALLAAACAAPSPLATPAASTPAAAATDTPEAAPADTPADVAASEEPTAAPSAGESIDMGSQPVPVTDGSRPLADLMPEQRADLYQAPPDMNIDPNKIYLATIKTNKGDIVAELYAERAPLSVNNFVTLASLGYYDGLTWHRVEKDPTPFVIQGGDPLGTGQGGPGYTVPAEIGIPHIKGALAYARLSDQVNPTRASSGSQFYITLDATPQLDGGYTVFGQVIEGMDVADQIEVGDTIERIDISEAETSQAPTPPPPTPTPEPKAPAMEEGRPLADLPLEERDLYYNVAPGMVIDTAKTYQATFATDKGEFVIDLNVEGSPMAVNSFVLLSELGFYDNMPVAFVQPDNYAILGSPLSQPNSDAGYTLEMEPGQVTGPVPAGTVIMYPLVDQATGEVRVSGSQFLIAFTDLPEAGAPLAVLGQISSGQDVVNQLEAGDMVTSVTITEN